ncbi:MAG: MBL fold metallo-hydrolase [Candidatus Aminicenantes bacterium]|nr:MBL fold metallo-hydrolase [Candidatus Aminicenantes bacterium]
MQNKYKWLNFIPCILCVVSLCGAQEKKNKEVTMDVEQVKVGQMVVFSYIVSCPETKEALVIDPGGDEKLLAQKIKQKGLTLKYIVNTHGHSDHTCGNAKLKSLTGAKIIMHEIDDNLFRTKEAVKMMRGMGFEASPAADITVKDGDEIKIGKVALKVLHTPGHTPGGICLLAEGQVFTGDTLFVGGIGRTDLPGSDHRQFMNAIRDKLAALPDETIVWPGHDYGPRPSSTIGLEKIANPWVRQLIYH